MSFIFLVYTVEDTSNLIHFSFSSEDDDITIAELENCKYILDHIRDKEAMQIINLF